MIKYLVFVAFFAGSILAPERLVELIMCIGFYGGALALTRK